MGLPAIKSLPGALIASALLVITALPALAQQAGGAREDFYRAEIVIVERKVDPQSVNEHMASRDVAPVAGLAKQMWVVDAAGNRISSLNLTPRSELTLNTAANRLENSGRFRVVAAAGWYQSFPPNYNGEAMQVAVGDWLAEAGHRDIEGQITINRQRYLHVDVELNHWRPSTTAEGAELITWIRENRRMRSEEVHYLDSPTIGVLVFFNKVGE